jgi:hypothetical protein
MTRLYARAPRREAGPYGKVPRNRGKNTTTLIASITIEGGMGETMAMEEGAIDAEAFVEAYVEYFLAPTAERRAGGGARQARGAQDTEGHRAHRSKRRSAAFVLAVLLAGSEPHRGGFQQDKGHGA